MTANVLVIGSGGREHALCWKLSQSDDVKKIYVVPGNIGIQKITKIEIVDINIKNFKLVSEWCLKNDVKLVVVGPEDPLAGGIANELQSSGIHCFGPTKEAAQIESDKTWAKEFMKRHEIPTAQWGAFSDASQAKKFIQSAPFPALVVKASGLAAGKGVVVAKTRDEACQAVERMLTDHCFGDAGSKVVVEELLTGEEVSVLAFSDGNTIRVMLPSQDHKRLKNNDEGPNTGGMGAYCPCPLISAEQLEIVKENILKKTVDGMRKENVPFIGVLYAGLMITKDGPKVLEFNCRFGDPETQVIMPLLDSDLYRIMMACCCNQLASVDLRWKQNLYAVGVVMASKNYPESSTKGNVITGLLEATDVPSHLVIPSQIVFHSGTALSAAQSIVTNGGRVLIAVAIAPELTIAAARARKMCSSMIQFDGAQYRTDIAHKGIARSLLQKGRLTYKDSGVDICAGDSLVRKIKSCVASTNRSGVLSSIGGFGGVFDLPVVGYSDPLLVSGTDGVGTKLKVAQLCGIHTTVGIDLVAMCVNDILAQGAEPLFFLDYFATGNLNVDVATQVVSGVAEGCHQANCALIGGETAEMPGLYAEGDYDLAGFAVGAVERMKLLPALDSIVPGDVLIGIPSSGIHSNGFSLVRKVVQKFGIKYQDKAPFSKTRKSYGEEFLTPTKIYVRSLLKALQSQKVKALAHITGGGLTENIPRVLPEGTGVKLNARCWEIPSVFGWLAAAGEISEAEMLRTFNCGIGVVLIVSSGEVEAVQNLIAEEKATVIGKVEKLNSADEPRVHVENFIPVMEEVMRPFVDSVVAFREPPSKRVGVLISGSGTNLQSLIDATTDLSQGIGAEIVIVISNKPGVKGLERARKANIPTQVIRHTEFGSRYEFDMALHAALVKAQVDIVCLAGFMRVLTGDFVRLWRGRLINIHPALLPLFKGTRAHRQALQAGVRVTGCTAHFVEEDVDAGAILAQEAVQIELYDTEESLQERVKIIEHKVFPKALKLVATEKVYLDENGKLVWKN